MILKRSVGKLTVAAAFVAGMLGGSALVSFAADAPQAKPAPKATAKNDVKRPRHHFSFAGKRPSFRQEGTTKSDVAVSSIATEGLYTLQDEIWYPNFVVSPHFHKTHHETFYVVSGRVEWTVGGETHVMGAGDSVHIPANTVHSVKVLDGKNAHMLMIYAPGGYEEHMARTDSYSLEQLKDPKVRDMLRELNDFNPVQ